jgi:hypothetical protein
VSDFKSIPEEGKEATMKNTVLRSTILGLSVLGLSLATAQTSATLKASVPFGFSVGEKAMPAGECVIRTQAGPNVVAVKCGDNSATFALANNVDEKDRKAPARLIFHRYGDRYYLSQIWPGYGGSGSQLPATAREREMTKTAARATTIIRASR